MLQVNIKHGTKRTIHRCVISPPWQVSSTPAADDLLPSFSGEDQENQGEFILTPRTSPASLLLEEILMEGLPVKKFCQWTTNCLNDSTSCPACQELWRFCLEKAHGRVAKKKMTPLLKQAWEQLREKHFPPKSENEQQDQAGEPKSDRWADIDVR